MVREGLGGKEACKQRRSGEVDAGFRLRGVEVRV